MTDSLSTRTQEWRSHINNLSRCCAYGAFYYDCIEWADPNKDNENISKTLELLKKIEIQNTNELCASLKYENAYKFSYLRNYMWAIYKHQCRVGNGEFLPAFHNQIFANSDEVLYRYMDEDVISLQLEEGVKLDDYMHHLTFYYVNPLLNLADGGNRRLKGENCPEHHRLLQLHRQLENETQFDEIAVIRSMLCNIVVMASKIRDAEAIRVFSAESFKMLNEMNSRPVMT